MAGGIEKRTSGLGRHFQGVAEQLLNGLSLLAHLFPSGSNRTNCPGAVPPASTGVRISYEAESGPRPGGQGMVWVWIIALDQMLR